MMDDLSKKRVAVLARFINKAPRNQLGRTQMMKLFYFLQELKDVPLGYDFRLFTYGPFDSEVLSDLATACSLNTVNEQTILYPSGYGYVITSNPHAHELSRELEEEDPDLASAVDDVINEFGSFGAADLELRSTIFFVDREFSTAGENVSLETIVERVHQIKPHFENSTILQGLTEMREKGWIECTDLASSF